MVASGSVESDSDSSATLEPTSPSLNLTDFSDVSTEDPCPGWSSRLFNMLSIPCGLHVVPMFVASAKGEDV